MSRSYLHILEDTSWGVMSYKDVSSRFQISPQMEWILICGEVFRSIATHSNTAEIHDLSLEG